MEEEWRPVVGYKGLYEISNLGRVKSVDRVMTSMRTNSDGSVSPYTYHVKEKILKQGIRQDGYSDVSLSNHGKTVLHCIHRLLAEAWIPNPNNFNYVNHKDLDKTNNSLDNLEWISNAGNVIHAVNQYSNTKQCKPIYCLETNEVYPSMGQCERSLGLPAGSVTDVINHGRGCKYTLRLATEDEIAAHKASLDSKVSWTFDFHGKGKRLHPIRKIKCIETQAIFDSLVYAESVTGLCGDTIRDSIRQKRSYNELTFYYLDDPPEDEETYKEECAQRYYDLTHHKANRY